MSDNTGTLTRRDSLKGLAGIIAAGVAPAIITPAVAGSANGGLQYRNLGARLAAMGGGGLSWRSYSQTGIIHQYDGEQNTRGGYSASSPIIEDLVGNINITVNSGVTFANKRINYDGVNGTGLGSLAASILDANRTIEICIGSAVPQGQYSAVLYSNYSISKNESFSIFVINKAGLSMRWNADKPGIYVGGENWAGYQPEFDTSSFTVSAAYDDNKNCCGCCVNGVDAGTQFIRDGGPLWGRYGLTIGAIPGYTATYHYPMWLASIRVYSGNRLGDAATNYAVDQARFGI